MAPERSAQRLLGRNASENPAGIETVRNRHEARHLPGRNASENPAGIETIHQVYEILVGEVATHQKTQQGLKLNLSMALTLIDLESQRIRKPSRD